MGQAAVIDTVRTWTTLTEQLTRTLRFPIPEVDVAGIVDRAFDIAEQTLAAHHQLARTLAGVATRHLDIAAASARPDRTPDRRTYEERSLEELRGRARELEIEGRSTMSKDELIAALRQ
jgi:hypothetical protein